MPSSPMLARSRIDLMEPSQNKTPRQKHGVYLFHIFNSHLAGKAFFKAERDKGWQMIAKPDN